MTDARGRSTESTARTLARAVGYWFALNLSVGVGVGAVLRAALVDLPSYSTLHWAGAIAALVAAWWLALYRPDLNSTRLFVASLFAFGCFVVLGYLTGVHDPPLRGSPVVTAQVALNWVVSAAAGAAFFVRRRRRSGAGDAAR